MRGKHRHNKFPIRYRRKNDSKVQNSIVSDYIVVVQRRSFEAAGFLLPSTVLLSRSWLTAQACELLLFSIIVNCHHDDQHPFSFLWRPTLFVDFLLLWQLYFWLISLKQLFSLYTSSSLPSKWSFSTNCQIG